MTEPLREHYHALASFRRARRARRRSRERGRRIGEPKYAITFPPSWESRAVRGRLHTPSLDPGCPIPEANAGTVTVEAIIDPATGAHTYAGASASGACIDAHVIRGLSDLVCDAWSSDPIRDSDGAPVALEADETVGLTVEFPILASRGSGR